MTNDLRQWLRDPERWLQLLTLVAGVAGALFAVPIVAFANATLRAVHLPLPPTEEEREEQAKVTAGQLPLEGYPE